MNTIVIVESPTKAKTIGKYLGSGFTVLASYGHVRDLPSKDGSVKPDDDFAMSWKVDPEGEKHIKKMGQALQSANNLCLATDPDREGEAISWHIYQELYRRKLLKDIDVNRVVFHEITPDAIQQAMEQPRPLNQNLIDAYLARRALDYLVGFTLSPVLWRKLPGSRSAGRVQSVCLRLICEREAEIERFKKREYWSIEADCTNPQGQSFSAQLSSLDGSKLEKMALSNQADAERVANYTSQTRYHVGTVERKTQKRHPRPPFTTSTLQQEAFRKLGLATSQTMRLAQKLFEGVNLGGETVGLITYMRTDSVFLSSQAVSRTRKAITQYFDQRYLPDSPRHYKTKAKNAQEAHEAIRPTDPTRHPDMMSRYLGEQEHKLYDLIWRRTVACQMESADIERTSADIVSDDQRAIFRASGTVIVFDGFLALYQESQDHQTDKNTDSIQLPQLVENQAITLDQIRPQQHFTQPPQRYSEASLVKKMEELGIGRPSTYASIIHVLQSRTYVRLEKKHFIPEDRGRIVTAFLENFFSRYVGYDFTAEMENQLDDISNNREDWKHILSAFWAAFTEAIDTAKDLSIREVIDALDEDLGTHFFPESDAGDPRLCTECGTGRLGLKLSKRGGFIGCSNYPDCRYTRPLAPGETQTNGQQPSEDREIGQDPESGLTIRIRKGPYGLYVQKDEANKGEKPKRSSLPKNLDPDSVDLETALSLLSLPRPVGTHPTSGEPITAGIGRYGPYLLHQGKYTSLRDPDDVLTIGINRAVDLLAEKKSHGSGKLLGEHPEDGQPVTLKSGRYGPYVQHGRLNASIPATVDEKSIDLNIAVELLRTKAQKKKSSKRSS